MTSNEIGQIGEDIARKYLIENGYEILDCNYSIRQGEIDIVALFNNIYAFVEVKTRKNTTYGRPCEFVDYRKIKKIKKAALKYITDNNLHNEEIRFDVIEILLCNGYKKINHIENAFC